MQRLRYEELLKKLPMPAGVLRPLASPIPIAVLPLKTLVPWPWLVPELREFIEYIIRILLDVDDGVIVAEQTVANSGVEDGENEKESDFSVCTLLIENIIERKF